MTCVDETPKKIVESKLICFLCGCTLNKERVCIFGKRSVDIQGLIKAVIDCYVPLIKNLAAILSNDQLEEALLHSSCKCIDGKFKFMQDGAVLSNHPLFTTDPHTLELILYSDEIEICNAVGTRVKKHKLLMFYYLLSNLPKKYRSTVDAINYYAVVTSEDVSTYGFDIILQPLLEDLTKLGMPSGNLICLMDGRTICVRASLVAYVADNPAAHQAIGLKESVGGSFRKCRFCRADFEAMQNGFSEDDFEPRALKKTFRAM